VPHRQHARGWVNIAAVERDRLSDPDAGDRQQPDQRGQGGQGGGVDSDCAASISAATSASEYKYGLARRGC